jgi:hypothetical protein
LICHIIPHIYAPILYNFSSISEDKNSLQTNTRSVVEETSDCSYYQNQAGTDRSGPVPSRQNILARQRRQNGTETWRRPSCQCEYLSLITHGKILLNGDVTRRNGNVTYSVNRLLLVWDRSRAFVTRDRRLTAWALVRLIRVNLAIILFQD